MYTCGVHSSSSSIILALVDAEDTSVVVHLSWHPPEKCSQPDSQSSGPDCFLSAKCSSAAARPVRTSAPAVMKEFLRPGAAGEACGREERRKREKDTHKRSALEEKRRPQNCTL
ncbi:hypothetical protein EYF80_008166 [Liparis tanakae]|uniref:Uncharacterized protein n=1 Tax=Liparis tanakae TaxID=230148 RepID=A0A4Z2IUR3_9TELE|nr:hypothetical protein EYF80_008166 [Liparis tanakae]